MKNILSILEEKATSHDNTIFDELNDDIAHLKFASMTSMTSKQSFLIFKTTLIDNLQKLLFENIKQHLIVQCYNETQYVVGF